MKDREVDCLRDWLVQRELTHSAVKEVNEMRINSIKTKDESGCTSYVFVQRERSLIRLQIDSSEVRLTTSEVRDLIALLEKAIKE